MKMYIGARDAAGNVQVTLGGIPLNPRFDLRRLNKRNPTKVFDYGKLPDGPTVQLALAILADYSRNDRWALRHYHRFAESVLCHIFTNSWKMSSAYVGRQFRKRRHNIN